LVEITSAATDAADELAARRARKVS
jgi:hypothetical protein